MSTFSSAAPSASSQLRLTTRRRRRRHHCCELAVVAGRQLNTSLLLLLLLLLLVEAPSAARADDELCFGEVLVEADSLFCNVDGNGFLTDGGFLGERPNSGDSVAQPVCRQRCLRGQEKFKTTVNMKVEVTDCSICEDETIFLKFKTPLQAVTDSDSSSMNNDNLCIPNDVCRRRCENDLDANCVYTGSCRHAICFSSVVNDEQANVSGVTHTGEASDIIFMLPPPSGGDGEGTEEEDEDEKLVPTIIPAPKARIVSPVVANAVDTCEHEDTNRTFVAALWRSESYEPFLDARLLSSVTLSGARTAQCRVFNNAFGTNSSSSLQAGFEVVRIVTGCNFCSLPDAAQYFGEKPAAGGDNDDDDDGVVTTLCVPRAVCEENCDRGAAPAGCQYSGSCGSLFCLSGRVSKRPAEFPFFADDGSAAGALVNNVPPNDTPPYTGPPVFANDGRTEDDEEEVDVLPADVDIYQWDALTRDRQTTCTDDRPTFPASLPESGGGGGLRDPDVDAQV